jgi:hypothetical protein
VEAGAEARSVLKSGRVERLVAARGHRERCLSRRRAPSRPEEPTLNSPAGGLSPPLSGLFSAGQERHGERRKGVDHPVARAVDRQVDKEGVRLKAAPQERRRFRQVDVVTGGFTPDQSRSRAGDTQRMLPAVMTQGSQQRTSGPQATTQTETACKFNHLRGTSGEAS